MDLSLRLDEAAALDRDDPLAPLRDEFERPVGPDGNALSYLCGHSLGLMPRAARAVLTREIDRWAARGVEGHFDPDGWYTYHERFARPLADLLGADPDEVIAMNALTVNLHLMLATFYRPARDRVRILIEPQAFPSDRFAVESQLRFHRRDPDRDLVILDAAPGQSPQEALERTLARERGRVALVLLPGVHYLTGEAYDLAGCAGIARRHDCRVGFDLAHAIGNLDLDLRRSEPDFAVWCSYKYLNAGPGATGGCFVNRRWADDRTLPRLAGWWGHDASRRFASDAPFSRMPGAQAWQLSNPSILAMAPLEASLDVFAKAGIGRLRRKSVALTGFLETLVRDACGERAAIVTPSDAAARGAQLSVRLRGRRGGLPPVVAAMRQAGVVADWRDPDLLRLAPVPLYNRFADAHRAAAALVDAIETGR